MVEEFAREFVELPSGVRVPDDYLVFDERGQELPVFRQCQELAWDLAQLLAAGHVPDVHLAKLETDDTSPVLGKGAEVTAQVENLLAGPHVPDRVVAAEVLVVGAESDDRVKGPLRCAEVMQLLAGLRVPNVNRCRTVHPGGQELAVRGAHGLHRRSGVTKAGRADPGNGMSRERIAVEILSRRGRRFGVRVDRMV